MLLHQLLGEFNPAFPLQTVPNVKIEGICEDSRLVNPGDLFIARMGTKTEGSKFVDQARVRGAVAVVSDQPIQDCPLPLIVLPNLAEAASQLAHVFCLSPSRAIQILGVTGTNG